MRNALHDPIWFTPPDGSSRVLWKDSPSPPPAPDYTGAATATAAGNLENAKYATAANRINQYSPYGSETYAQGNPGSDTDPQWRKDINLSPVGQQLLDYANNSALGLGALQGNATSRVGQTFGQPMDINGYKDATASAYQNMTSRLDPQWAQNTNEQETKLRNQGLVPGGEAYDNAMRVFNQGKNDAYQQANLGAMGYAPTAYQLDLAARNQPLNELNALRTGSQVTNPQFNAVPQQQATPGANYMGAAQAQGSYDQGLYNSQVGSQNSFMSGLAGIGSSALGAYGTYAGLAAMSDIRLKSNIVRIGDHPLGIGIYEYDIFGKRDVGVMAQEVLTVKPEAVSLHPSGYLQVHYGRL